MLDRDRFAMGCFPIDEAGFLVLVFDLDKKCFSEILFVCNWCRAVEMNVLSTPSCFYGELSFVSSHQQLLFQISGTARIMFLSPFLKEWNTSMHFLGDWHIEEAEVIEEHGFKSTVKKWPILLYEQKVSKRNPASWITKQLMALDQSIDWNH